MKTKNCNVCGEELPLDRFGSDSSKPGGLNNTCKTCKSAYKAQWQRDNRAHVNEKKRLWARRTARSQVVAPHPCPECGQPMKGKGRCPECRAKPNPLGKRKAFAMLLAQGLKVCTVCQETKPTSDFGSNGGGQLASRCKTCLREVAKESSKKYRKSGSGREKVNARNRAYRKTDTGKALNRKATITRRQREAGVENCMSSKDIAAVYDQFMGRCFKCGTSDDLSIDHHRPLKDGNGMTMENAVVLCRPCNSSKGAKSPEEFYSSGEMLALRLLGKV